MESSVSRALPASIVLAVAVAASLLAAETPTAKPGDVILHLDFAGTPEGVTMHHGAKQSTGSFGGALEFTNALQYAELDFSRRLDGIKALSVGGWFQIRRAGEGAFLFRGLPEIAPLG